MIAFNVTDNALPAPVYRQLRADYHQILSRGLLETGNFRNGFSRFNHYDAYMAFPYPDYFTPYDIRKYACSAEFTKGQQELVACTKTTKDISFEMHYHKPNGKAGNPHTDWERVWFNERRRQQAPPLAGWNIWQNRETYRVKFKGGSPYVRRIATLVYMNDDWQEGDGGELTLFKKEGEQFIETHRIAPLGNRIVTLLIDDSSFHSTEPCSKERKSVVWWYHDKL